MGKVLIVTRHELSVNLRRVSYVVMTLAVPAVGLVGTLLVVYFGGQIAGSMVSEFKASVGRPIGYVDRSGWVGFVEDSEQQRFRAFESEESASAALSRDEISGYFVVSADYLKTGSVMHFVQRKNVFGLDEFEGDRIRTFLVDNLLKEVADPALRARLRDPIDLSTINLAGHSEEGLNVLDFAVPYAFSALLIVSIFTSSGFLLQSVAEEKENRVVEVLLSSVSPLQLMAGKIIGLGILGLVQVAIWFGSMWVLGSVAATSLVAFAGFRMNTSIIVLSAVYFLLGYLVYAAFMAAAGAASTTLREGQQLASIVSIIAAVPFMLSSLFLTNPDAGIIRLLSYFPLTAPVMMMQRMAVDEVTTLELGASIALLVLGIVIGVWGAAKIFRVGILMYGQRLGFRQLWQALR